MDGRRRSGGRPDVSYGNSDGIARNRSVILGTIHGYYKEALAVRPLDDLPELAPLLVAAGVCFGFADPTTNIIANTLSFLPPDHSAKKRKRKTKAAPSAAAARSSSETRAIAERSLEGLVTFLTSYFRYLPTWDALRYLRLANTDLLVAVRLIELNRGCYNTKEERFQISSYAARAALTCAASSARQPNVDGFIAASFSLASHLEFVTQAVIIADRGLRRSCCFLEF
uniref:PIR2-like helical domain-containing protein n=1 Tax=Oryza glumipatula TaxID=40148 RepID=A0A0E0ADZ2_9ORYZ